MGKASIKKLLAWLAVPENAAKAKEKRLQGLREKGGKSEFKTLVRSRLMKDYWARKKMLSAKNKKGWETKRIKRELAKLTDLVDGEIVTVRLEGKKPERYQYSKATNKFIPYTGVI